MRDKKLLKKKLFEMLKNFIVRNSIINNTHNTLELNKLELFYDRDENKICITNIDGGVIDKKDKIYIMLCITEN